MLACITGVHAHFILERNSQMTVNSMSKSLYPSMPLLKKIIKSCVRVLVRSGTLHPSHGEGYDREPSG